MAPALRSSIRQALERLLRAGLLALSRRRALGRAATALPITRPMVARFVAGETMADARPALRRLRAAGLLTTLDVLGEEAREPDAARAAAAEYVATLDGLAQDGLDRNVSLKLSQMGLRIDPDLCRENVARVVERAAQHDAFVRFDMEDHTTTDATLALARVMRDQLAHGGRGDVGVVIQASLKRSPADLETLIADGTRVRLCKGAYREPPDVAFQDRHEVDAAYERLMATLLAGGRYPAIATHDERLIRRAITLAREHGLGRDRFEFQMLYGVRRDLQARLVRNGWRVRVYVPFGREWYPYFMRRLAERPANVAFVLRSLLRERGGATGGPPGSPRETRATRALETKKRTVGH